MSSMIKSAMLAGAMLVAGTAAAAAAGTILNVAGNYKSTGTVVSTNSDPTASPNPGANCAALGLVAGNSNNSVFHYPGPNNTGFSLYVGKSDYASGAVTTALQLCNGFPAVPAAGLNGWTPSATCAISVSGNGGAVTNLPGTMGVNFAFTSTTQNANTSIGTTTISIPTTAPVGGGCTATVSTVAVRVGK